MNRILIAILLFAGAVTMASCYSSTCTCECVNYGTLERASYKLQKDACRNAAYTTNIEMARKNDWDTCVAALSK